MTAPSDADVAGLNAVISRQRRELDEMRAQAAARSIMDLARGMLMEQLGCSPAEAERQLGFLAEQAGTGVLELAAQLTRHQPPDAVPEPGAHRVSLAGAAIEAAPDGRAIAAALLDEALAPAGAVAVALWLIEPDGGLALAGQAGFGEHEASRWRRIHPDMSTAVQQVARDAAEIWWPAGPPEGDDRPLMGGWRGGARVALPLRDAGVTLGSMLICWPAPLDDFPGPLRRQLAALADLSAQALGTRPPDGGLADDHRASWVFGLMASLLEPVLFAQAIRDDDGKVTDFRLDHVGPGFRDPTSRSVTDLTGRKLLDVYPEAALAGGLFSRCVDALVTGEPQYISAETVTAGMGGPGTPPLFDVRVARLYDGVAIAWRGVDEAGRLAALLQHAQRLGRIGSWEENMRTGEVYWTEPTYALFGQPPGTPVPLADLHTRVPADDVPAVEGFLDTLLRERRESAAAFRLVRADDGSVRQMRAYAEPHTDSTGSLVAVRGAFQDVSADYHTRLAFAAAREQLADTEERAEEEHRLAVRLQQAITPRSAQPVEAAGLDVAARYRPAGPGTLVSGDWYDTVILPNKDVLLVVGDIAGHGIGAVTGMVAMRNCLRGLAITGAGPATLIGWLNAAACHLGNGIIGTAVCGLYDPVSRTLRWARAGHLPPVLVRNGRARRLPLPRGILLGADPDTSYAEAKTSLRLGDILLLFTDGLIERRDQPIDEAIDVLLRVASRPAASIGRYADDLVARCASSTDDDACLVAVHVR